MKLYIETFVTAKYKPTTEGEGEGEGEGETERVFAIYDNELLHEQII